MKLLFIMNTGPVDMHRFGHLAIMYLPSDSILLNVLQVVIKQWLDLDQNFENNRPYHRTLDSSVSFDLCWS
jgi:hypothetical protein